MTGQSSRINDLVAVLARAFDNAFAAPLSGDTSPTRHFLAVRVGGDPYALCLEDLSGVFPDRSIVKIPSGTPGFLGIIGVRGNVLPAYGLRAFFGYPPDPAPRWLAVTRSTEPVALAFDRFDGYLQIRQEDAIVPVGEASRHTHVRDTVRAADVLRAVVDVVSVLEEIRRLARRPVS